MKYIARATGDDEKPGQTIAEYERSLCEHNGVGVAEADGSSVYSVRSSDGKATYQVEFAGRTDDGFGMTWKCSCPSRITCKHIRLVSDIVATVNDEFGL